MKAAIIALALVAGPGAARAEGWEAHEKAEGSKAKIEPKLTAALGEAKVSLEAGLKASEPEGKPISGKFEMEDGKLQLSIYTTKGGTYEEVLVDYKTGKIAKAEKITGGDDLAEAKKQAEAMAKTSKTLLEAVAQAEKANPGFRVLSVTPELEGGKAMADVELVKGTQAKRVEEKL